MAFGRELKPPRIRAGRNSAAGVTPGLPHGGEIGGTTRAALVERCPTKALSKTNGNLSVDYRRCVHCYRCVRDVEHPLDWPQTYEWAAVRDSQNEFGPAFTRSIHIIVVDAGDCGACLNEVKQLNNPYYNMHRLGFFITPTPRHADVMLVVGPVTDHMRFVLQKIYDAMPTPKRVVAVGACAVSGGVFAESFVCAKGVAEVFAGGRGSAGPSAAAVGNFARAARGGWPQDFASLVSPPTAIEANSVKS